MQARINEIPFGNNCYLIKRSISLRNDNKKKFCPYLIYLENGNTMCLLENVESCDDEIFSQNIKICGINEEL